MFSGEPIPPAWARRQLTFPVTNVIRPLLFGQLIPDDDPVWQRVGDAIGLGLQAHAPCPSRASMPGTAVTIALPNFGAAGSLPSVRID